MAAVQAARSANVFVIFVVLDNPNSRVREGSMVNQILFLDIVYASVTDENGFNFAYRFLSRVTYSKCNSGMSWNSSIANIARSQNEEYWGQIVGAH